MNGLEGNGALDIWLAQCLDGRFARVLRATKLSGGAIQENWMLDIDIDGRPTSCVLRRDAPAGIAASRSRLEEFALLSAAWETGVTVPRPLGFCSDASIIGAPFALMEKVGGTAYGPRVVRDTTLGGDRAALGRELGRQLARIHDISPKPALAAILAAPPDDPGRAAIERLRQWLDDMDAFRPGLEWALRWAERHLPAPGDVTVTHQDFRTGNVMIDSSGLTAILDWEFAALSDPISDIGWFCAECWRFSRPDLEAGGLCGREDFYAGYSEASGRGIDPQRVFWWEVIAHVRWATIALQQGHRHASGAERSLHLALTGRIADAVELMALRMTAPGKSAA